MSDTNEITTGCLFHYDTQYLQVRKDFLSICSYNREQFKENPKEEPDQECMAKILRLLETLTDTLKTQWRLETINAREKGLDVPPEPKVYKIELTYGGIGKLLSMQEPGYAAYGESTIRNSVTYLLHLNYISRHQELKNSRPNYWLNLTLVQATLKQKAEARLAGVEINSQKQVLKSTAKRPKSTASPLISTAKRPKSTAQGVEINTNNISNKKDKNKLDIVKGEGESDDEEENSSDSPPELTPTQKLVQRINEIRSLFNTAMGTTVVWNKDNQEGAKDLAEAEKSDEDILLAIKDIQDDPDQFDLKQINLKVIGKRIDGRLNALKIRQSRPPQQQFPPTTQQSKPQFRKPTLMGIGVSPPRKGLDLDAIAAQQDDPEWLRTHAAEVGVPI